MNPCKRLLIPESLQLDLSRLAQLWEVERELAAFHEGPRFLSGGAIKGNVLAGVGCPRRVGSKSTTVVLLRNFTLSTGGGRFAMCSTGRRVCGLLCEERCYGGAAKINRRKLFFWLLPRGDQCCSVSIGCGSPKMPPAMGSS